MLLSHRLALLVGLACSLHAQDSAGERVHYWNGDQRVEAVLALDEIAVQPAGAPALRREALPAAGKAELAERLAKGGHAVLRRPGARPTEEAAALTGRLAVRVKPGADLAALAMRHGLERVEAVPYAADTWILSARDPLAALAAANALYEGGDAEFATPLIARQMRSRATTNDPQRSSQWHLPLIRAEDAWNTTQGAGINIAIVDDGLELAHPDLSGNARTTLDIDINDDDADPSHALASDGHGTVVGGVAAADGNDGVGTVGVAYAAGLIGVRLISKPVTDAQTASAMNHGASTAAVHVSNNSWGPGQEVYQPLLEAPGPLMRQALANATTNGRGGLGIVFCWAAGNSRQNGDNAAYDGFPGNRYTIGVGATDHNGIQASYSESGCNVMIAAPGGAGGGNGMVAPDRLGSAGYNTTAGDSGDYLARSANAAGTSFASPVVAGVAALVLATDPSLGWRDVMNVLIRTARKNDETDIGWSDNGAGLHHNHKYGYGLVAADLAVAAVAGGGWAKLPAATEVSISEATPTAIPDDAPAGLSRPVTLTTNANFRVEHVELTVDITHPSRGELAFELTAPSGKQTLIPRRLDDVADHFSNWIFTSVAHWGENPNGTWTLRIIDGKAEDAGTLKRWNLRFHGHIAPGAPVLAAVAPTAIATGSADTTIAITGSNFDRTSVVHWAGTACATTFVSATRLDAVVPASLLASSGMRSVTVVTPPLHGSGGGTSSPSEVRVTGRPTITGLAATGTTAEDTASGAFAFTIADDDPLNGLTVSATSSVGALVASSSSGIAITGTGGNRSLVLTPNPDANSDRFGTSTITVTVSDGSLTSLPASLVLTVTAVADPPTAEPASLTTRPGTTLVSVLAGNDPDGTAVTFQGPTLQPEHGIASISASGQLSYQPAIGFVGLDRLTFTVSSGGDTSAPATVLIAVDDPTLPRPRLVSEPSDETVPAGEAWSYTVVADRREVSAFDSLRFTLIDPPAGMSFVGGGTTTTLAAPEASATITWTTAGADVHVPVTVLVECAGSVGRGFDLQRFLILVDDLSTLE